jgi:hypothetical protein
MLTHDVAKYLRLIFAIQHSTESLPGLDGGDLLGAERI